MMKPSIIAMLLLALTSYAQAEVLKPRKFKDPAQQNRYDTALREAARYDAERQAAERKVKKLEPLEIPAKIVKGSADASVNVLEKKTGLHGRAVGYAYKEITDSIMDPQAEQKQKAIKNRQEQEYRENQENQRLYWSEFNRLQEQRNRQIQRFSDRIYKPEENPKQKKK